MCCKVLRAVFVLRTYRTLVSYGSNGSTTIIVFRKKLSRLMVVDESMLHAGDNSEAEENITGARRSTRGGQFELEEQGKKAKEEGKGACCARGAEKEALKLLTD